jgi:hypothetical protein
MGAGQLPELRPTDIGSMISNGGQPSLAAWHNEPPPEPAPPLTLKSPSQLEDGAVVFEGELAWKRLRAAPTMADWLAVGKALLLLRKQAVAQAGTYKGIIFEMQRGASRQTRFP